MIVDEFTADKGWRPNLKRQLANDREQAFRRCDERKKKIAAATDGRSRASFGSIGVV
jgi:hypothetical protein